jgi:amino acid transporter
MTSVLLVFQMGQPRIWMSMSRDGLLPQVFEKIHPKYKTPSFSTIVTGLVVGVPILFTDKTFVLDFTSIATLFAFVLVCGGVLLIPRKEKQPGKFNIPYINGRFIFPLIIVASFIGFLLVNPNYLQQLFSFSLTPEETNAALAGVDTNNTSLAQHLTEAALTAKQTTNISTIIFWLAGIIISILALVKKYSLIPLLGLITCLYLLTGMTARNWAWFGGWLVLGLIIYFLYGYRRSRLAATADR